MPKWCVQNLSTLEGVLVYINTEFCCMNGNFADPWGVCSPSLHTPGALSPITPWGTSAQIPCSLKG